MAVRVQANKKFVHVKSKAEVDKLINAVVKDQKAIQSDITDSVVGEQFANQEQTKQQKPILEGFKAITEKLDERLAPARKDREGNVLLNPDKTIQRDSFIDQINIL